MTSPRDYLLTPEQMGGTFNNILRGASKAPDQYEAMRQMIMNNQVLQAKAKNAPENEREDLLKKHLANLIQQPKADTAYQQNAADLLNAQNVAKLTGQQAQWFGPSAQATINSQNASTNKTNKLLPGEILKQSIENDWAPRLNQATITQKSNGGMGHSAYSTNEKIYLHNIDLDNPQLNGDPEQIREARNVLSQGGDTLSNGKKLNPMSRATSEAYSALTKNITDVGARAQQRFANTLETTFKAADVNADKAFQYAGLAGKAKQGFDAFTAQSGQSDPNYEAFVKFTKEDVPAMVTEIIRTGGANSTNAQKAIATEQAMQINMRVNPKLAKASYDELKKIYRAIGKTISKNPAETLIDLRNQGNEKNPTDRLGLNKPENNQDEIEMDGNKYKMVNGEWVHA